MVNIWGRSKDAGQRTPVKRQPVKRYLPETNGAQLHPAQWRPKPIGQKYGENFHFANVIFIVEIIG